VQGTTELATIDNVISCATGRWNDSHGVWYSIDGTGIPLTISTCIGTNYDTKISVYSGSCSDLNCIEGNDDFCSYQSQVTFDSELGDTYFILVHGFSGTDYGPFTLTISSCPPEISVTPSQLTFNVPENGTDSRQVTISNTAGPNSFDLNWNILDYYNDPNTNAGGPDAFGYSYIDSDQPGGPAFEWIDIRTTGNLAIGANSEWNIVSLPFPFTFYGSTKTSVTISSYGYLSFGSTGKSSDNHPIPEFYWPNNLICPFWDNFYPNNYLQQAGSVYYMATSSQFIVQYTNVIHLCCEDPSTFQVILNADGTILFQYLDMQGDLTSATVGIENEAGNVGLEIAYNEPYVHNNLTILISPVEPCSWITSLTPVIGNVSATGSQSVTVQVDATGLPIGTYYCELGIFSDATISNQVFVPVVLNVGIDTEPPVITLHDPISLWPPNGSYENFDLYEMIESVVDNIDGDIAINSVVIDSVSSDEPDDAPGAGDGNTIHDILVMEDCKSVDLRAERAGGGDGRVYTIHLSVSDAAGNVGTAAYLVNVPHDMNGTAIDSEPSFMVYSNCINGDAPGAVFIDAVDHKFANAIVNAYPNPFRGSTHIDFMVANSQQTRLVIFNSFGKQVAKLFEGMAEENQLYKLQFYESEMPAGIYYYHLTSGDNVSIINKLILIK
jgi:hypothetical protein